MQLSVLLGGPLMYHFDKKNYTNITLGSCDPSCVKDRKQKKKLFHKAENIFKLLFYILFILN